MSIDTHRPGLIVALAVAIVAALSFVPWSKLTSGFIKDFDLIADIRAQEIIEDAPIVHLDSAATLAPDSLAAETDTVAATPAVAEVALRTQAPERIDGILPIEDYTYGGLGLQHLKSAIESGSARVAVMGDSYIEGDIFTQDIRSQLQEAYGGRGVGYMPAHSQVAGFRRTALVKGSGWTQHKLGQNGHKHFTIMGESYTAGPGKSTISYTAAKSGERLKAWSTSSILFVAPTDGSITLVTDNDTLVVEVTASDQPQFATLTSETSHLSVSCEAPGLVFLGAWLQDANGITVDCMSIRGDSGMAHRNLNTTLSRQTRAYIDYDLIILEYGINALTAEQTNYNSYAAHIARSIEKIREAYPAADILMLGVGDRGQKVNGTVESLPTIEAMVDAQRRCAQKAGVLFWDTREAMGGKNAVVDWRERGLVNPDYIHLNSAGGKALASQLVPAIKQLINK